MGCRQGWSTHIGDVRKQYDLVALGLRARAVVPGYPGTAEFL